MRQRDQFQTPFLFSKKALYKIKANGQHLSFSIFWQASIWAYNENKLYKIQTVDAEIYPILIFYKRVRDQVLYHISCMTFQEKYILCYIRITDHVLLFGWYLKCFSFSLWRHKENINKKSGQNVSISRTKRAFNMK